MNEHVKPHSHTILIVEDEEIVAIMAIAMMDVLGYATIHCADGATAIDLFRRKHQDISLVILDMVLPDMTGSEIYDEFKKIDPQTTCLLSSGFTLDDTIKNVLDHGADDFIHKPFKLAEFKEKIERLIQE